MKTRNVTPLTAVESDRLAISIEGAAWKLSVSPSFLRLEIRRGRIRPVRLGRRVLISEVEVERYLATHMTRDHKVADISDDKD